jgi:hypothetical protein
MKVLYVIRHEALADRTLGTLHVFDGHTEQARFATLELPWRDNKRNVSRIPAGVYSLLPRSVPKFGDHFHVEDVEGRSWILIHAGNYPQHTQGCILLGMNHLDINGDGIPDVSRSKMAMEYLTQLVREPAKLVVVNAP